MKKIFIPLLLALMLPAFFSCSAGRFSGYRLNERDAAAAIRQMLEIGTRDASFTGAFTKETMISAVFPESIARVLKTVQQLGLTDEVDRFANTLGMAAEKTATNAVPLFVKGINNLTLADAMRIVKTNGTPATDYLRSSIGADLRQSLTPVMKAALNEYKIDEQWNELVKSTKIGSKLNLDLATIMAGLVSERMFQQIAQKETEIRNNAAARRTTLLQKVFSRDWK